VEEGYDRASTNRIALAAGVSIGSLYQYFPSKEALVAALVEEHLQKMSDALSAVLTDAKPEGLPETTRVVVKGLIAAYRVDARLHQVLCQEVPKVGELRKVYHFEDQLARSAREYLDMLRESIRHEDLDRAVFLLAHAVPSVIRAAVSTDPEGASDESLCAELTDLILRYLMINPPT